MDRLFRQSKLFREKWDISHHSDGATYGETTLRRSCEYTPETYKPPKSSKSRNYGIYEQDGCYWKKRGDTVSQLTNFTINPIEMVVSEDEAQLTCDLVTDSGETFRIILNAEDFTGLQKLKKAVTRTTIAIGFFGTETDVENFKVFLHSLDWKIKKGIKLLGIFHHKKSLVFVTPTGAVGAGGKPVDTIVQMEKYKKLESNILSFPFISLDDLRLLGELILSYNEPAKTVPILAWIGGCYIKPHLKRLAKKYPHLFLIGEGGGGKSSSLENIIMAIFGKSKATASSQVTPFTLMSESNSSNIIPQMLDEFKPSKLHKITLNALYNHFRDSYDGHEGIRGRADQTIVTYDLLAPIIVAGEEAANETAIRERTIELLFSKRDLKGTGYEEVFHKLTQNSETLGSFGRTLLDVALRTTVDEVAEWYAEGLAIFKGDLPSRIVSNLSCVYAGLKFIEKLCLKFKQPWDYIFPISLEMCAKHLIYAVREYLLDGGLHNKSVLEQTFEVMSRMNLKPNRDFVFESGGRHLCLCLSDVYDRYTRYCKDYAVLGENLSYTNFKKQLAHSEYFIAKNEPKWVGNKTRRVWIIDFDKLASVTDVGGFQTATTDEENG